MNRIATAVRPIVVRAYGRINPALEGGHRILFVPVGWGWETTLLASDGV